jgi:hypothetical protein
MSDKLRNGFQKKSVRIARVYYRFRGFRVSIYLLEFILISPFCYTSCVYSLRLASPRLSPFEKSSDRMRLEKVPQD